ncbi:hypothetical protein E8E11_001230 [Didymella keratinophila]|nr:hypothetical protein E8E11_001230 [Didymella keratinophila]
MPATRKTTGAVEDALNLLVPSEPVKRKRGRPRLEPPYLNPQKGVASVEHDQPARMTQLEKNRIAADKCRRQRKEYTSKLLARHSSVSARNETLKADVAKLREQVLGLKHEVLQHAKCGSWMIDGYVARIAGDLSGSARPNDSVKTPPSAFVPNERGKAGAESVLDSQQRKNSADHSIALSDHGDLWFLDYDRVMEDQRDP